MVRCLVLVLTCWLVGCAAPVETLRPAAGGQPAIRAAIERPEGPGPFPAAVLLHGCAGPRPNAGGWSQTLRAQGWLVAVPDQFGPRGIAEVCTWEEPAHAVPARYLDTIALVALLRARPDVRADRIVLIGFSQGGHVAAQMASPLWGFLQADALATGASAHPPPAAAIAVYPPCGGLPNALLRPVLIIAAGADDWTPAQACDGHVRFSRAELPPRLAVIEGAHHGFDDPGVRGIVVLRDVRNGYSPTGRGATVSYSHAATRQAEALALDFLRGLP